jgi:hypothetical protein
MVWCPHLTFLYFLARLRRGARQFTPAGDERPHYRDPSQHRRTVLGGHDEGLHGGLPVRLRLLGLGRWVMWSAASRSVLRALPPDRGISSSKARDQMCHYRGGWYGYCGSHAR